MLDAILKEAEEKMQKSLENGGKDISLYEHDIMECYNEKLDILDIANYRIEKIPFVG